MISIITPTYNRAHILSRAIKSVLNQTFLDWELIIVDDGSADNSKELILSFNDSRIQYVYQENKGVCFARNHGASIAKGEYITFLDSDDYVTPFWLNNFNEILSSKKSDIIFCDMDVIDLNKNTKKTVRALYPFLENKYSEDGLYLAGTFCIKNSFFKELEGFDENIKFGEFTEFSFRCMKKNPSKSFTQRNGFIYEASQEGSRNSHNKIEANLYIINKHDWFFKLYPHALRLYFQNIGVAYSRLSNWSQARLFFWKAYCIQPWKFKTLIRFFISFYPYFAKKIIK